MNARKCRNWQTSKTKDLVSIALVWVQVPSSAFIIRKGLSFIWKFFFVSISIIPQYIIIHEKVNKKKKIKGKQKVLSNNNNEEIQNVLF